MSSPLQWIVRISNMNAATLYQKRYCGRIEARDPLAQQWLGLVLGLIGVPLVLHDRSIVLAGSPLGWVASFGSLFGITLGTHQRAGH
jgi:hypothetical protein